VTGASREFSIQGTITMKLIDALQEKNELVANSNRLLAGSTHGSLSEPDRAIYRAAQARINDLDVVIADSKEKNTLSSQLKGNFAQLLGGSAAEDVARRGQMSAEYNEAFLQLIRSGGKHATSALSEGFDSLFGGFRLPAFKGMQSAAYEGGNSEGGYAFSTPTDQQIVPLALTDIGVRSMSMCIATSSDLKVPQQATFATAAIKAESGASSNTFTESEPTLAQFTLTAWMLGLSEYVSWELLQDVSMFQTFAANSLIQAVDLLEDSYFVSGNGSSAPQGLLGNVGVGTGTAYAVEGTGAYLLDSTMDVQGKLKGAYFANAAFLMSRATATAIRRAQIQANLFAPVWTREGGRDFLHGFPVTYSQNMPAIPTTTTTGVTPILFGSFKDGYLIGDRGGAGTFVKILDQPAATAGQTILLGYKRVDGRVRVAESIQGISISHS
jgi:HK97 family phage major capsid protein